MIINYMILLYLIRARFAGYRIYLNAPQNFWLARLARPGMKIPRSTPGPSSVHDLNR
jgi:hypothetical protein